MRRGLGCREMDYEGAILEGRGVEKSSQDKKVQHFPGMVGLPD